MRNHYYLNLIKVKKLKKMSVVVVQIQKIIIVKIME